MSKNYIKVKSFYETKLWSYNMVHNAVNRWITSDEFLEITGTRYEDKKA